MSQPAASQQTLIPVEPVDEPDRVEAAARALFARDCRRSVGLASADYVWPRVRDEYRRAAQAALDAAEAA